MDIPEAENARFESYVAGPPLSTATLKARLKAARAKQTAESELGVYLRTADQLLEGIARKTTPLHVRLIHAAAAFLLERSDDGPRAGLPLEADRTVLRYVIGRVRKPELMV